MVFVPLIKGFFVVVVAIPVRAVNKKNHRNVPEGVEQQHVFLGKPKGGLYVLRKNHIELMLFVKNRQMTRDFPRENAAVMPKVNHFGCERIRGVFRGFAVQKIS